MLRAVRSLFVLIGFMLLAHMAQAGQLELLSQAGTESDTATGPVLSNYTSPSVSADGRWVAFDSHGVNLAAGQRDRNGSGDVFLHDRQTGATVLVSHAGGSATTAADGDSGVPSISDDGRWVVYRSTARDLVPGQVANSTQLFVNDRETGVNALVSHSAAGPAVSSNGFNYGQISGDGAWIVFVSSASDLLPGQSDPQGLFDVFLQERATGQTMLVSRAAGTTLTAADNHSFAPSISDDGRYVAFLSQASNLIPGYVPGPAYASENVFLFDRVTGTTTLASRTSASATTGAGAGYPDISPDGAFVAFGSEGANLLAGQTDTATPTWDLFLFDRASGATRLVSHAASSLTTCAGAADFGDFQAASGYVVYRSLVSGSPARSQVFLFRLSDSALTLVSRSTASPSQGADGSSFLPRITPDGAFVVFQSSATDLVAGQGGPSADNVYLFDRAAGTVVLASGSGGSDQVTGNSVNPAAVVSDDGSLVAYATFSTDLAAGKVDLNATTDVALYDRSTATLSLATLHAPGQASATPSMGSVLASASADGRYAVFLSPAPNVIPGQVDTNELPDVFLVDRAAGTTTLVSRAAGLPITAGNGASLDAAISADGAWVAFLSRSTDHVPGQLDKNMDRVELGGAIPGLDVFLYDRAAGTTTLVSHAAGFSLTAGDRPCGMGLSLSGDGRWVSFLCSATNLVPGQIDGNNVLDLFLYDRVTGTTMLVSRKAGTAATAVTEASQRPRISEDGRWIGFLNSGPGLVAGAIDANFVNDLFLFDRDSGQTLLVSRAAGTAATAANSPTSQLALSPDGRYAAFTSTATNLLPGQTGPFQAANVFLFDRVTGAVELISRAAGTATTTVTGAFDASVSADGRYVAFRSTGTNLIPGQTAGPGEAKANVFVHDRVTRQTELISRSVLSPSRTSNGDAEVPTLSPDGRYVAFVSKAADLAAAAADRNVFLADRQLQTLERVAEAAGTDDDYRTATGSQEPPLLSADGSVVLFASGSPDLVSGASGDWNGDDDVFAWVRSAPAAGDFFTLAPCRLIDTRQAGQGPALASGVPALLQIQGACGIPATARAVAVNVTALQGQGAGSLVLYPGNLSTPNTNTISFQAGQNLANNAILPLASNGEGTLGITPAVSGGGTVHAIVDVSGYLQ